MYVQHFIRIRTLIYLESATPAVDQPLAEVDGRKVDKMLVSHLSTMAWFTAATLPSFIKLNKKYSLYKKRGQTKVIYSIYNNEGNAVPKRTNVSPINNNIHIYTAWQPSLMLGGLGRAQRSL